MSLPRYCPHQHIQGPDGDVLLSQEGTTQGDPLAMPMYALATIPLIRKLKNLVSDVNQVWYADDASGAGRVTDCVNGGITSTHWALNLATSPMQAKPGLLPRRTAFQTQQQLLPTRT